MQCLSPLCGRGTAAHLWETAGTSHHRASRIGIVPLLPDRDAHWGARQAEGISDLVLQVSLVGEVKQPGVVAEDDEMRGLDTDLGQ